MLEVSAWVYSPRELPQLVKRLECHMALQLMLHLCPRDWVL